MLVFSFTSFSFLDLKSCSWISTISGVLNELSYIRPKRENNERDWDIGKEEEIGELTYIARYA